MESGGWTHSLLGQEPGTAGGKGLCISPTENQPSPVYRPGPVACTSLSTRE